MEQRTKINNSKKTAGKDLRPNISVYCRKFWHYYQSIFLLTFRIHVERQNIISAFKICWINKNSDFLKFQGQNQLCANIVRLHQNVIAQNYTLNVYKVKPEVFFIFPGKTDNNKSIIWWNAGWLKIVTHATTSMKLLIGSIYRAICAVWIDLLSEGWYYLVRYKISEWNKDIYD